jgi:ABC-type transport system involved in multi-copper enzyme maturation permease subunit
MTDSLQQLLIICPLLCLLQALAALPWLWVLDPDLARQQLRRPVVWGYLALGSILVGAAGAFLVFSGADRDTLAGWGRVYGSVLQLQLSANFFVFAFAIMLYFWPKGGAVALAAFREGIRQPMFWLLTLAGLLLIAISPFIPYFTFGEDYKMVKELGYSQMLLFTAAFAVIAASTSISEEIEGRTAITLMSKPVSRRHFLLGKFIGILLAALVMCALLVWLLVWILLFKDTDAYERLQRGLQETPDPAWLVIALRDHVPAGEGSDLLRGVGLWMDDSASLLPGVAVSFCHVMILLAVAVALATRLPMLVTVPLCLAVYFLGHLTPILKAVAAQHLQEQETGYQLIAFLADVFDTVLPGLDLFDLSPAVIREAPLPPARFSLYTLSVSLYALVYTAIALLFGLILFEDRDLA